MKTLALTVVGIGAFLVLVLIAMWVEARERLGDTFTMIFAALVAIIAFYFVLTYPQP